jgi:hypothetical protein
VFCVFSRLIGGELARALAVANTVFEAAVRALASTVSGLDPGPGPSPGPVVLAGAAAALPAFWAAVMLPRLFSFATALAS